MPRFMVDTKLYGWDASEQTLLQKKNRILLLSIGNIVISLVCGLVSTNVTRHSWVGFAATAALIALMMEVIGAVRFRSAKVMLDKRGFDSVQHMLTWSAQCHMVLMAVAWIAGMLSCFQAFGGVLDILILLGFMLSLACSFFLLRTYQSIPTHSMKAPE
ncbi:MAG: hypothetical protein IJ246_12330 [Clostridia bacterium]|nr:hypothetical protein [Clostridia bacterium]